MDRRQFLAGSVLAGISTSIVSSGRCFADNATSSPHSIDYKTELQAPAKFFDGKESYCHPRAGIVPGAGRDGAPRVVMTFLTIDLSGSDVFKAMYLMTTDDLGTTWSDTKVTKELSYRTEEIEGQQRPVACSDFWPAWHKQSKRLLGIGHTAVYTPQWKVVDDRPRETAYSAYDASTNSWQPWQRLNMGGDPKFEMAGAGCSQRVDLPNGEILLPIYFRPRTSRNADKSAMVVRCSFDGIALKLLEIGDALTTNDGTSGLGESSLAHFGDYYYITMRNNIRAFVARSRDGLHFEPIRPWTFDDGSELGNYETQQHWVTHSDALFLVYTRRGLKNDHVFRHRAPLLIGQVDPERMCVLRATERELMPNRGARLGNFGVTNVSPDETWVTDSEWMQPKGCEKYGSDGTLWVSRLHWKKPNRLFEA